MPDAVLQVAFSRVDGAEIIGTVTTDGAMGHEMVSSLWTQYRDGLTDPSSVPAEWPLTAYRLSSPFVGGELRVALPE